MAEKTSTATKAANEPAAKGSQREAPLPAALGLASSLLDLQRAAGNQSVASLLGGALLQPKLRIGPPADAYEREADRVADAVLRIPDRGGGAPLPVLPVAGQGVQRPTASDSIDPDKKEAERIARIVIGGRSAEPRRPNGTADRRGGGSPEAAYELHSQLVRTKGNGKPLDGFTKTEMESKLGVDLNAVRVHTDHYANEMSASIDARAFTYGRDIYFNSGEFHPASGQGKELLAHELVHTAQQSYGDVQPKLQRQEQVGVQPKARGHEKGYAPEIKFTYSLEMTKDKLGIAILASKMDFSVDLTQQFFKDNQADQDRLKALSGKITFTQTAGHKTLAGLSAKAAEYKAGEWSIGNDITIKIAVTLFEVEVKKETSVGVLQFEFEGRGKINSNTILESILAPLALSNTEIASMVQNGMEIDVSFKVKCSFDGEAIHRIQRARELYSQKKVKADTQRAHVERQQRYRRIADETRIRKKAARAEREILDAAIRREEGELKRIQGDRSLTPEQANEKIDALKKEISEKRRNAHEVKEVWKREKNALKEAHRAANAEMKAAKRAGKALTEVEKQIEEFDKRYGRFERVTERLERGLRKHIQRIERRLEKLDRLGRNVAENSAKWIEKKAVRWIGVKLAIKAGQLVAKFILRAIPVIGTILLIWDAVALLWDLGSVLWDWLTGEERTGEGEREEGEDGKQGESDVVEASDTGTVEGEPGRAAHELPGGGDTKAPEIEDTTTPELDTKDTTRLGVGTKDTTVTLEKDVETPTDTTTAMIVKPVPMEPGTVLPWELPSKNAKALPLRHGAAGLDTGKLVQGENYTFRLTLCYKDAEGKEKIVEADADQAFKFVYRKNGVSIFAVVESFVIQTSDRKVYYEHGQRVWIH